MDPLHPIITPPPAMPPVSPAARSERIARDRDRQQPGQGSAQQRDRRPAAQADGYEDFGEPSPEEADGDDRPHIDITA